MVVLLKPFKGRTYKMPTHVVFGRNCLSFLPHLPLIKKSKKIVLVSGKHLKNSKEFRALLSTSLSDLQKIIPYKTTIRRSTAAEITKLIRFLGKEAPDSILAMGGGTVLDVAKCAAILVSNGGCLNDFVSGNKTLLRKGIPLVAVPTTAGTGSEVTPWAVIWDYKKKTKYSLSSPLMFPKVAVVDPSLTDSLPEKITAETGFDALTQAIEAFWSVKHNPVSDRFALTAIKLIMDNLPEVVNKPKIASRDIIMKASLLAGLAFSNTQTTLCHSVSYPLTAHFKVIHGQAVAITLPVFFEYIVSQYVDSRRRQLLGALKVGDEAVARKKITRLMMKVGLKTRLSELGIGEKDVELIVKEGFDPNRAKNSPIIPSSLELKQLLYSIK